MSNIKRVLNWKPDLPDARDFRYSAHPEFSLAALPPLVDLVKTNFISPIVDQGSIGSCTGNGWAGMLETLQLKELFDEAKQDPSLDADKPEVFGAKFYALSRLFIYFNERVLEGTVSQDSGAMIRTGMKAIRRWGICPEVVWPYSPSIAFRTPSKQSYDLGAHHKILAAYRLDNGVIDQLKTCLSNGFPVVFGMSVYNSFMSSQVAQTGVVPMPKRGDYVDGGHCLLIVGYDDSQNMFKVKNSWGKGWGKDGYCYIPYAYLTNRSLASDFWTARRSQDSQVMLDHPEAA